MEAENEAKTEEKLEQIVQGYSLQEIMNIPTTIKKQRSNMNNVAKEVEERLETIKLAVIKATKATINGFCILSCEYRG